LIKVLPAIPPDTCPLFMEDIAGRIQIIASLVFELGIIINKNQTLSKQYLKPPCLRR